MGGLLGQTCNSIYTYFFIFIFNYCKEDYSLPLEKSYAEVRHEMCNIIGFP